MSHQLDRLSAPLVDPAWRHALLGRPELWVRCLAELGIDDSRASMVCYKDYFADADMRAAIINHIDSRIPVESRDDAYRASRDEWLDTLDRISRAGRPPSAFGLGQLSFGIAVVCLRPQHRLRRFLPASRKISAYTTRGM